MGNLARVLRNFQVTLPKPVRKRFNVREGDVVKIGVTARGILITPLETVDRAQSWFWSKEWQAGEKTVAREIRGGKIKKFDTIEDFLKDLGK